MPAPEDDPAQSPPAHDVGDLWKMFHGELRGFARKRLESDAAVDDVLQAAFLRAHQAIENGQGPEQPRAWLFHIVRNLVRDTYRARARQTSLQGALEAEPPVQTEADADEREAFEVVARALPQFIATLSSPYDEALHLTEILGLTQAEAAERAGVTTSCMKARVRRGREQVHAALLRCCSFEVDGRGRMTDCAPRRSGKPCGSCG